MRFGLEQAGCGQSQVGVGSVNRRQGMVNILHHRPLGDLPDEMQREVVGLRRVPGHIRQASPEFTSTRCREGGNSRPTKRRMKYL